MVITWESECGSLFFATKIAEVARFAGVLISFLHSSERIHFQIKWGHKESSHMHHVRLAPWRITFTILAFIQDYFKKPSWEFYICICSKMVVKSTVTWYPLYEAQCKKFISELGIRNKLKICCLPSFYNERDETSCVSLFDLDTRKLRAESYALP